MKKLNSTMSRRTFVGALATGAAAGYSGLGNAQSSLRSVKVGFTAVNEYTGLFVGVDKGFFAKRGLNVEPVLLTNNALIPSALVSGSIDIGTPGINILLVAVDGGLPLKLVCGAGMLSASRPTVGIIARTGSNITKPADFAGKRIAVPGFNAGFHVTAREWLLKGGQDLKAINFVETSFAQMPDLLKGGQVDAVVAGEPMRGRILEAKLGYQVDNMLTAIKDPSISGTYATTETYAANNPQVIKAYRDGIMEAHEAVKTLPAAETLESVAKYLKLPIDLLKQVPSPILNAGIDIDGLTYWIDLMVRQGLMKKKIGAKELVLT